MYNENFIKQVQLLLQCLPAIREQDHFAIKGGTALNLLLHDLPRLSVDIDLTYKRIENRDASLQGIQAGIKQIAETINNQNPQLTIKHKINKDGLISKLFIFGNNTMIKLEPNFIHRGTLYPIEHAQLCPKVNDKFNAFLDEVPMLTQEELYAGKICAALNRQHPRDLFDIKILYESSGLTDSIRKAFVVYLACDSRPMHELLVPNRLDIKKLFINEFVQMTEQTVILDDLLDIRETLITDLNNNLSTDERQFLLSIKQANPDFSLMPYKDLRELPAIKWKLLNISKMQKTKRERMLNNLKDILDI